MDNKYIITTIILISLAVGGGIYFLAKPDSEATIENITEPTPIGSGQATMEEKLIIQDITVGTGAEAVSGKKITVNYSGTFTDGTKFDSSYDRGTPFTFTLGAGEVIQGWDQGFAGMKVGGKRKLTVPPSLGYGPNDYQSIPGNSTLIFEVELLNVE